MKKRTKIIQRKRREAKETNKEYDEFLEWKRKRQSVSNQEEVESERPADTQDMRPGPSSRPDDEI